MKTYSVVDTAILSK